MERGELKVKVGLTSYCMIMAGSIFIDKFTYPALLLIIVGFSILYPICD